MGSSMISGEVELVEDLSSTSNSSAENSPKSFSLSSLFSATDYLEVRDKKMREFKSDLNAGFSCEIGRCVDEIESRDRAGKTAHRGEEEKERKQKLTSLTVEFERNDGVG